VRCRSPSMEWRQHCVDDAPVVSATFAAGTLARVRFNVAGLARCPT
jgi:hypothetical protein